MKAKTKAKTTTKTPDTNNHYYKLLEKKFHSSDIVRSQIAEIKERVKKTVIEEPLKSLSVSFKGQVVGNSFEKTLKIISKHVFMENQKGPTINKKLKPIIRIEKTKALKYYPFPTKQKVNHTWVFFQALSYIIGITKKIKHVA